MNSIIFVLILASSDGGINTDLKFTSLAACKATAVAMANESDRLAVGWKGGFRYVTAICVAAKDLISR